MPDNKRPVIDIDIEATRPVLDIEIEPILAGTEEPVSGGVKPAIKVNSVKDVLSPYRPGAEEENAIPDSELTNKSQVGLAEQLTPLEMGETFKRLNTSFKKDYSPDAGIPISFATGKTNPLIIDAPLPTQELADQITSKKEAVKKDPVLSKFNAGTIDGIEDDVKEYFNTAPKILKSKFEKGAASEEDQYNVVSTIAANKAYTAKKGYDIMIARGFGEEMKQMQQDMEETNKRSQIRNDLVNRINTIQNTIKNAGVNIDPEGLKELIEESKKQDASIAVMQENLKKYDNPAFKEKYKELYTYIEGMNDAETIDQNIKASLPEFTKKLAEQQFVNEEIGATEDVARRALNSITNAIKNTVLVSPIQFGTDIGKAITGNEEYSNNDRVAEWLTKSFVAPTMVSTVAKHQFLDPMTGDPNWNAHAIIGGLADQTGTLLVLMAPGAYKPNVVNMLSSTVPTFGRTIAKDVLTNMSKTALPAYFASYKEYSDEAAEMGLEGAAKLSYANWMSGTEVISEMILPNHSIFTNDVKKGLLKEYIKGYINDGVLLTGEKIFKKSLEFGGKEALEEYVVNGSKMGYTAVQNALDDKTKVYIPTINELITTGVTAGILGGLMGVGSAINEHIDFRNYALYKMANNFELSRSIIESSTTKEKAAKIIKDVQKFQSYHGQMPEGLSDVKKSAIIPILHDINALRDLNKTDIDETLKKINEDKIKELTKKVANIIDDATYDQKFSDEVDALFEEDNKNNASSTTTEPVVTTEIVVPGQDLSTKLLEAPLVNENVGQEAIDKKVAETELYLATPNLSQKSIEEQTQKLEEFKANPLKHFEDKLSIAKRQLEMRQAELEQDITDTQLIANVKNTESAVKELEDIVANLKSKDDGTKKPTGLVIKSTKNPEPEITTVDEKIKDLEKKRYEAFANEELLDTEEWSWRNKTIEEIKKAIEESDLQDVYDEFISPFDDELKTLKANVTEKKKLAAIKSTKNPTVWTKKEADKYLSETKDKDGNFYGESNNGWTPMQMAAWSYRKNIDQGSDITFTRNEIINNKDLFLTKEQIDKVLPFSEQATKDSKELDDKKKLAAIKSTKNPGAANLGSGVGGAENTFTSEQEQYQKLRAEYEKNDPDYPEQKDGENMHNYYNRVYEWVKAKEKAKTETPEKPSETKEEPVINNVIELRKAQIAERLREIEEKEAADKKEGKAPPTKSGFGLDEKDQLKFEDKFWDIISDLWVGGKKVFNEALAKLKALLKEFKLSDKNKKEWVEDFKRQLHENAINGNDMSTEEAGLQLLQGLTISKLSSDVELEGDFDSNTPLRSIVSDKRQEEFTNSIKHLISDIPFLSKPQAEFHLSKLLKSDVLTRENIEKVIDDLWRNGSEEERMLALRLNKILASDKLANKDKKEGEKKVDNITSLFVTYASNKIAQNTEYKYKGNKVIIENANGIIAELAKRDWQKYVSREIGIKSKEEWFNGIIADYKKQQQKILNEANGVDWSLRSDYLVKESAKNELATMKKLTGLDWSNYIESQEMFLEKGKYKSDYEKRLANPTHTTPIGSYLLSMFNEKKVKVNADFAHFEDMMLNDKTVKGVKVGSSLQQLTKENELKGQSSNLRASWTGVNKAAENGWIMDSHISKQLEDIAKFMNQPRFKKNPLIRWWKQKGYTDMSFISGLKDLNQKGKNGNSNSEMTEDDIMLAVISSYLTPQTKGEFFVPIQMSDREKIYGFKGSVSKDPKKAFYDVVNENGKKVFHKDVYEDEIDNQVLAIKDILDGLKIYANVSDIRDFVYSYATNAYYISDFINGNTADNKKGQAKVIDILKRLAQSTTNGITPDTKIPNGVGEYLHSIVVKIPRLKTRERLPGESDSEYNKSFKGLFDGQELHLKSRSKKLSISFGSTIGEAVDGFNGEFSIYKASTSYLRSNGDRMLKKTGSVEVDGLAEKAMERYNEKNGTEYTIDNFDYKKELAAKRDLSELAYVGIYKLMTDNGIESFSTSDGSKYHFGKELEFFKKNSDEVNWEILDNKLPEAVTDEEADNKEHYIVKVRNDQSVMQQDPRHAAKLIEAGNQPKQVSSNMVQYAEGAAITQLFLENSIDKVNEYMSLFKDKNFNISKWLLDSKKYTIGDESIDEIFFEDNLLDQLGKLGLPFVPFMNKRNAQKFSSIVGKKILGRPINKSLLVSVGNLGFKLQEMQIIDGKVHLAQHMVPESRGLRKAKYFKTEAEAKEYGKQFKDLKGYEHEIRIPEGDTRWIVPGDIDLESRVPADPAFHTLSRVLDYSPEGTIIMSHKTVEKAGEDFDIDKRYGETWFTYKKQIIDRDNWESLANDKNRAEMKEKMLSNEALKLTMKIFYNVENFEILNEVLDLHAFDDLVKKFPAEKVNLPHLPYTYLRDHKEMGIGAEVTEQAVIRSQLYQYMKTTDVNLSSPFDLPLIEYVDSKATHIGSIKLQDISKENAVTAILTILKNLALDHAKEGKIELLQHNEIFGGMQAILYYYMPKGMDIEEWKEHVTAFSKHPIIDAYVEMMRDRKKATYVEPKETIGERKKSVWIELAQKFGEGASYDEQNEQWVLNNALFGFEMTAEDWDKPKSNKVIAKIQQLSFLESSLHGIQRLMKATKYDGFPKEFADFYSLLKHYDGLTQNRSFQTQEMADSVFFKVIPEVLKVAQLYHDKLSPEASVVGQALIRLFETKLNKAQLTTKQMGIIHSGLMNAMVNHIFDNSQLPREIGITKTDAFRRFEELRDELRGSNMFINNLDFEKHQGEQALAVKYGLQTYQLDGNELKAIQDGFSGLSEEDRNLFLRYNLNEYGFTSSSFEGSFAGWFDHAMYKEINDGIKKLMGELNEPNDALAQKMLKGIQAADKYDNVKINNTVTDPKTKEVTDKPIFTDKLTPEYDKLPFPTDIPTMAYAGIGSRQTPPAVMAKMTELAKELEKRGYTARTGDADGADAAIRAGAMKKEVYTSSGDATEQTRKIAREIHPTPDLIDAMKNKKTGKSIARYVWGLHARNTNQVFGKKLDSPVDFVIAWTKDGKDTGGTGQAIRYATGKGIPVINLFDPNWREQLDAILPPIAPTQGELDEINDIFGGGKPKKLVSILDLRNNKIEYTSLQKKALLEIEKLVQKSGKKLYLLAGFAGTGKTTIAENIVKMGQQLDLTAIVIAPTTKAAGVLKAKLNGAGVREVEANTIHSTIYGAPDEATGAWIPSKDLKNAIIIVDEASMIDKELMDDLIKAVDENSKIVFMGDSFQLEQIGEDSGLFKNDMKLDGKTELTEIRRQSLDSNILVVATNMRTTGKPEIPSVSTEDFKISQSTLSFISDYKLAIKNSEDAIMLVATNNDRLVYNRIARKEKFGDSKEIVNDGEKMIAVANSNDIKNSELSTITSFSESGTFKLKLAFGSKESVFTVHKGYATIEVNDENNQKELKEVSMFFIPDLDKPSLYHQQILKALIKEGTLDEYLQQDIDYGITDKGKVFLSPNIVIATYGYAITGHKSQGSQWSKVFVHQNYVAPTWNPARWLYTAITRAADNVVLLPTQYQTKVPLATMKENIFGKESTTPAATTIANKVGDTIIQTSEVKGRDVKLSATISDIKKTEKGYEVTLIFKTYNGIRKGQVIIEDGKVIKTISINPLKQGEYMENFKSTYNFNFETSTTTPAAAEKVSQIKKKIEKELPKEISDAITVIHDVPEGIDKRKDLLLSIQSVLKGKGIDDAALIQWVGMNERKIKVNDISSTMDILDLITKSLKEKQNKNNFPDLKNQTLSDNFDTWIESLNIYPLVFRDIMMDIALESINDKSKTVKNVPVVSRVSLADAYEHLQKYPLELQRVKNLYKKAVIKNASDAVGHEKSESGKGHWIHVPNVSDRSSPQFLANVELLKKLSPSTWCTSREDSYAPDYVAKYDNYLLVVNDKVVVGIEVYADRPLPIPDFENESQRKSFAELQKIKTVHEVTSINNNGIASIDHLDDTLAFLKKHNISENDEEGSIKKAKNANAKKQTDKDVEINDGEYDLNFIDDANYYDYYYDDYEERHREYLREIEASISQWRAITTEQQAKDAVAVRVEALEYIPENLKTEAVVLAAVNATHPVLTRDLIPINLMTRDVIMSLIRFGHLEYIPDNLKTAEIVLKGMENGGNIRNVPENLITPEIRRLEERNAIDRLNNELPFSKKTSGEIQGYYDPSKDEVVLIAKNINENEASELTLHEVAHRGMIRLAKELGGLPELLKILTSAKSQLNKKLPELLKRTGHTTVNELIQDYGFDINTEEGKTKLLMELTARWAETLKNKPQESWWKKLLGDLIQWFKKFTGKILTEAQVNEMVGGFVEYGTHPAAAEKTYEEAKKEADGRPVIAQNFFNGYRPNSAPTLIHNFRPEFIEKYGIKASVMDLIKGGDRTRSTRLKVWMTNNNPKVGGYFWQGKEVKGPDGKIIGHVDKVLTRITAVYDKTDPRFEGNWSKEGWEDSNFAFVKGYDSAIEFEVVKPDAISSISSELFNPQTTKINIYSTDKNGFEKLSNILNGPIKATIDGKERIFKSVEHLYQVKKALFAGDKVTAMKIFMSNTGWDAQKLGSKKGPIKWTEHTPDDWDKVSSQELEDAMRLAFEQNESAKQLLLKTGNLELTHKTKFNLGKWEQVFPELLMKLRNEFNNSTAVSSQYKGMEVKAAEKGKGQFYIENNTIHIDETLLQKKFDNKDWTKSSMTGILPIDAKSETIKTYEDYKNFVQEMLLQKSQNPNLTGENNVLYLNRMNNNAMLQVAKDKQNGEIIGTSTNQEIVAPGIGLHKNALSLPEQQEIFDLALPQIEKQAFHPFASYIMANMGFMWAPTQIFRNGKAGQLNKGLKLANTIQANTVRGINQQGQYFYYTTDQNGNPLPAIPKAMLDLIGSKIGIDMSIYDALLINVYPPNRKLGAHIDHTEDESAMAIPIISVNMGSDGNFRWKEFGGQGRYGTYDRDLVGGQNQKLIAGDVLTFGKESRLIKHTAEISSIPTESPLGKIDFTNADVTVKELSKYRFNFTFRRAAPMTEQEIADWRSKNTNQIKYQDAENTDHSKVNKSLDDHIREQMAKMYPGVKVFTDKQAFIDYLNKVYNMSITDFSQIGAAFADAVYIDPAKAVQDTRFHEHAHIYVDALPADDPVMKAFHEFYKAKFPDFAERDEKIIQDIGKAGVDIAALDKPGFNMATFKAILRAFWIRVKKLFGVKDAAHYAKIMADRIWNNTDAINAFEQKNIIKFHDAIGRPSKEMMDQVNDIIDKFETHIDGYNAVFGDIKENRHAFQLVKKYKLSDDPTEYLKQYEASIRRGFEKRFPLNPTTGVPKTFVELTNKEAIEFKYQYPENIPVIRTGQRITSKGEWVGLTKGWTEQEYSGMTKDDYKIHMSKDNKYAKAYAKLLNPSTNDQLLYEAKIESMYNKYLLDMKRIDRWHEQFKDYESFINAPASKLMEINNDINKLDEVAKYPLMREVWDRIAEIEFKEQIEKENHYGEDQYPSTKMMLIASWNKNFYEENEKDLLQEFSTSSDINDATEKIMATPLNINNIHMNYFYNLLGVKKIEARKKFIPYAIQMDKLTKQIGKEISSNRILIKHGNEYQFVGSTDPAYKKLTQEEKNWLSYMQAVVNTYDGNALAFPQKLKSKTEIILDKGFEEANNAHLLKANKYDNIHIMYNNDAVLFKNARKDIKENIDNKIITSKEGKAIFKDIEKQAKDLTVAGIDIMNNPIVQNDTSLPFSHRTDIDKNAIMNINEVMKDYIESLIYKKEMEKMIPITNLLNELIKNSAKGKHDLDWFKEQTDLFLFGNKPDDWLENQPKKRRFVNFTRVYQIWQYLTLNPNGMVNNLLAGLTNNIIEYGVKEALTGAIRLNFTDYNKIKNIIKNNELLSTMIESHMNASDKHFNTFATIMFGTTKLAEFEIQGIILGTILTRKNLNAYNKDGTAKLGPDGADALTDEQMFAVLKKLAELNGAYLAAFRSQVMNQDLGRSIMTMKSYLIEVLRLHFGKKIINDGIEKEGWFNQLGTKEYYKKTMWGKGTSEFNKSQASKLRRLLMVSLARLVLMQMYYAGMDDDDEDKLTGEKWLLKLLRGVLDASGISFALNANLAFYDLWKNVLQFVYDFSTQDTYAQKTKNHDVNEKKWKTSGSKIFMPAYKYQTLKKLFSTKEETSY